MANRPHSRSAGQAHGTQLAGYDQPNQPIHTHFRGTSSLSSSSNSHQQHAARPGSAGTMESPGIPVPDYVQALHAFDPTALPSTSAAAASAANMYLRFKAGEIIRVWSKDEKGWWDGEITRSAGELEDLAGSTGVERGPRRGWFPSNYVKAIELLPHSRTSSGIDQRSQTGTGIMSRQASSASFSTEQSHSHTSHHAAHPSQASDGFHRSHQPRHHHLPDSRAQALHHQHHRSSSSSTRTSHAYSYSQHSAYSHSSHQSHSSRSRSVILQFSHLPESYAAIIHPINQSLALLSESVASNHVTHFQPATALVISAIRSALEQMDCLSKDSPTLVRILHLGKERKMVLVELSRLVACARSASGADQLVLPPGMDNLEQGWEVEYLERAFESVRAAIDSFIDAAARAGVEIIPERAEADETVKMLVGRIKGSLGGPAAGSAEEENLEDHFADAASGDDQADPADPEGDTDDHTLQPTPSQNSLAGERKSRVRSPPPQNPRMSETFRLKSSSSGALRSMALRDSSPPPPLPSALPSSVAMMSHGSSKSSVSGMSASSARSSQSGIRRSSGGLAHSGKARRSSRASGTSGTSTSTSGTGGTSGESTPLSATFRSSDGSAGSSPVSSRNHAASLQTYTYPVGESKQGREVLVGARESGDEGSRRQSRGLASPYEDQVPHSAQSASSGAWQSNYSSAPNSASSGPDAYPHRHSFPSEYPLGGHNAETTDEVESMLSNISKAEDALYSIIALFIGLIHSHSPTAHPSTHAGLIEMTKRTVDGIRDVLTVVESLGRSIGDGGDSSTEMGQDRTPERRFSLTAANERDQTDMLERLKEAKDGMYDLAGRLVDAAEILADAPFRLAEILSEEERKAAIQDPQSGSARDDNNEPTSAVRVRKSSGHTPKRSITPRAAEALRGYEKDKEALIRVASEGLKHTSHCAGVVRYCLSRPGEVVTPDRLDVDTVDGSGGMSGSLYSTPRPPTNDDSRKTTPRPGHQFTISHTAAGDGSGGIVSGIPGVKIETMDTDVSEAQVHTKRREVVGQRGVHTLSALHRKVESLGRTRSNNELSMEPTDAAHGLLGVPGRSRGVDEMGREVWIPPIPTDTAIRRGGFLDGVDSVDQDQGNVELLDKELDKDEDLTLRHSRNMGLGFGLAVPVSMVGSLQFILLGGILFPLRFPDIPDGLICICTFAPSLIMQTRPPLQHVHSSPLISTPNASRNSTLSVAGDRNNPDRTPTAISAPLGGGRSRSSSLTSPAPPRFAHRSPSRSADLDKFTSDLAATLSSGTASSISLQDDVYLYNSARHDGDPGANVSASGEASAAYNSRASIYSMASINSDYAHSSRSTSVSDAARSSGISASTQTIPQTPSTEGMGDHDDSPILGYLRAEASLNGSQFPRIGDLRVAIDAGDHDHDKTPVRSLRPTNLRLHTSPIPQPTPAADIRFWVAAHDYDPREIGFNPEGVMVAASLQVVVEKMTPHDGPVDPNFAAMFWDTWRLFTNPIQLLDSVMKRFECHLPPQLGFTDPSQLEERERALWVEKKVMPTRLRCYNFLKVWLEGGWQRGDADSGILERLHEWNDGPGREGMPAMAIRLAKLIQARMLEGGTYSETGPLGSPVDQPHRSRKGSDSRPASRASNRSSILASSHGHSSSAFTHSTNLSISSQVYTSSPTVATSSSPLSAGGVMGPVSMGHNKKGSSISSSISRGVRRSASFDKLRLATISTTALPLPLASPVAPLTPASATSTSGMPPPTPIISKSLHGLLQRAATATTVTHHHNRPPLPSPPSSAAQSPTTTTAGLPPPVSNSATIPIAEFDTLELARQLTLLESSLFRALDPVDLLLSGKRSSSSSSCSGPTNSGGVEQLRNLSTLSNQITGFVADGILGEGDAKKRASLLKFWVKVADRCLALQNFSSLFAILAALNGSTISRLKKTWDALSQKYRVTMDRLNVVIEHTKNHVNYRSRLRDSIGAVLPYLGLILTDVTFTCDGNPDLRPSALQPSLMLINIDKYVKLARIASDFRRYQEAYNFHEVESVQAYLKWALAERGSGSLDALYRKSRKYHVGEM